MILRRNIGHECSKNPVFCSLLASRQLTKASPKVRWGSTKISGFGVRPGLLGFAIGFLNRLPPGGTIQARKFSLNPLRLKGLRQNVQRSILPAHQYLSKESLNNALDNLYLERAEDKEEVSAESLWTTSADGLVKIRMDHTCSQTPKTVHQVFLESLEKYGNLTALSSKRDGKWERITYSQYYLLSRKAAKGFLKLGLERVHSVAVLGFNSTEWFISAVGTVFAGGILTGIYTTSSPEACQYIANDCKANVILVDTQKQLEKILKIWKNLPYLKAVVMYRETPAERIPNVYTMEEFLEIGNEVPDSTLDDILNSQKPNQCCVLVYTSGTTGNPKGVMLSQDNITWTAKFGSRAGDIQPAEIQQEVVVSYLPLSHIAAQMYDLWTGIQWGANICFAEPDALKTSLVTTLREVEPTAHMGVPRVWEKIMEGVKGASAQAGFFKRKMFLWAMAVTMERNLSCPSSSGKVLPGCKAKLVNVDAEGNGEICLWGRTVFMGYLNMEEKTREAIDEDGWLHTGDVGKLDHEGFLYITGRLKELIVTAGGENVPPLPIEEAVKMELPIISNAMLIGDQRKFLSMLLTLKCTLDPETSDPTDYLTDEALEFCQKVGSKATKVSEIVGKKDEAIYQAVEEGIRKVNEKAAAQPYRIHKWALLERDFSISGGEFGPTMKLKRLAVLEKYKEEIESFYKEPNN
ncbi:long-chain-fatty-acid--CoA ligase ACSBG1 isoform X5 [Vombatus ursinus]|uniref:long-chain-fatty-acid--CoA ligase ACSBG1 isoform X5 n=1 Tax=Vombatus ursinus TaxID=29139 RepID=UPI000FFD3146|nr:long-chain-fatty-acid--CoA ligase ACSBG1 isoform X5 [Vombatus ursinus]